jgi:hypothetical protein
LLRHQVALRSLLGTLAAVGCVVAAPASAAAQVVWKGCTDWGCVGQVKMNVAKAGARDITGTSTFSFTTNDEVYFEDLSGLRPKKILQLGLRQPHYMFFGVYAAEEVEALQARYQSQLAGGLVLVLVLMAKGFPEGASAIPATWTARQVEASSVKFTVSARKTARDAFQFRTEATEHRIDGDWIMTKVAPWPDSQSLAGWTALNGATIPSITLGEVRQFRRR